MNISIRDSSQIFWSVMPWHCGALHGIMNQKASTWISIREVQDSSLCDRTYLNYITEPILNEKMKGHILYIELKYLLWEDLSNVDMRL